MAVVEGWPKADSRLCRMGNPESSVAIATLWTDIKKDVGPVVDPQRYLIMGQLYSPPGISYMLRNIAGHTGIRDLVVCGADLLETGEAVKRIWEGRVNPDHTVEGLDKMELEGEIPLEAIARITERVRLHDCREWNKTELLRNLNGYVAGIPHRPALGEVEVFPEATVKIPTTFPSEVAPRVWGDTIGRVWLRVLDTVMRFGEESPTNYGAEPAKDVTDLVTVVNTEDPANPKFEKFFPFAERNILSYMEEFLEAGVPDGASYSYGNRIHSYGDLGQSVFEEYRAYIQREFGIVLPETFDFADRHFQSGEPRNIDQAEIMIRKLREDQNDRGAVAVLYDPIIDNQLHSKQYLETGFRNPCYVFIQAEVKKGKMVLTALARSNDMGRAWLTNAFGLRAFQGKLAAGVDVPLGPLVTISKRAHIYEHDYTMVQKILEGNQGFMHGGFEPDPRGVFEIRVEQKGVVVVHKDVDTGKQLQPDITTRRSDRVAETLGIKLDRMGALSQTGHGLYLGRELGFAQVAAETGIPYTQEDPQALMERLRDIAEKARKFDELQQHTPQ